MWFSENENHFIFQFSDDGAPETSKLTMSIGSMGCWNFGDQVQSRDFQYFLHCGSVQEKDQFMHDLWEQHTEKMKILTVCNKNCTVEFQPGADMSRQSWATNELNQAAKHPSPYANVHKGNMCIMGGGIGFSDNDTWKPFTSEKTKSHVEKVRNFVFSFF